MQELLTLKQHRKLKGLTVRELAASAKTGTHTITRIEAGQPARASTFQRIAEALGIASTDIREFVEQAMRE